ncbi:MAG TPA: exodeoxyribonuclease V subunit gamma, partial [Bacteroidota bacterium]|nr:exodeoxyribonuclease V subunit gamma [Bacteroidota bacterium]
MEHFHLFAGNNLELLAARLVEISAGSPPDGVFTPERIVVQSQGMQLWLSQFIARRRGICANIRFEYPDAFLQSLYLDIPGLESYRQEDSGWNRGTLAWILMRILPSLIEDERFGVVRSYLQVNQAGVIDRQKLFQLSVRIADVFDQYLFFRPDLITSWEEGRIGNESDEDVIWQALLWREVTNDDYGGRLHRARIQQELISYLEHLSDAPLSFPKRVTIFGISYLPRYYVDVLLALSKHIDVDCFVINPSIQYWSDAATPHQLRSLAARGQIVSPGNILLSSLAVEGRDFFEMLIEHDLDLAEAGYREPPCNSLLHCVQNDIYHYREAHADSSASTGGHVTIDDDDRSIVVQNCHSRLREMEVLHDHLLSMFESDPDLAPSDVIVMAPAIEAYAPYIEAVFTTGGAGRIPFSIADRPLKSEYKITQAFMTLLHFTRTRFAASRVIELLEVEHVATKFGMTHGEIGLVRMWIRDARIRWGLDREDAAKRYELPIDEVNTWRYGLNQMLLGYAFPSNDETRMFADILPFDNIEGSDSVVLAKLLGFFEALAGTEQMLREQHTLEEWSLMLQSIADAFFSMTYEESGIILPAIGDLVRIQSNSGYDEPVDIDNVIGILNGAFAVEGREARFMRGGVTFCSLIPMRSIPSSIICLIGMNHGDFPRKHQSLGFDEMVKHPRKGDRS